MSLRKRNTHMERDIGYLRLPGKETASLFAGCFRYSDPTSYTVFIDGILFAEPFAHRLLLMRDIKPVHEKHKSGYGQKRAERAQYERYAHKRERHAEIHRISCEHKRAAYNQRGGFQIRAHSRALFLEQPVGGQVQNYAGREEQYSSAETQAALYSRKKRKDKLHEGRKDYGREKPDRGHHRFVHTTS